MQLGACDDMVHETDAFGFLCRDGSSGQAQFSCPALADDGTQRGEEGWAAEKDLRVSERGVVAGDP